MTGRPFTMLPQRLYVVVVRRTIISGDGTKRGFRQTRMIRHRSDGLTHPAARELASLWRKMYHLDKVEITGPFVLT